MAGLLTCPIPDRLPKGYSPQWQSRSKTYTGLTAAGLSRILTWFPFNRWHSPCQSVTNHKLPQRYIFYFILQAVFYLFWRKAEIPILRYSVPSFTYLRWFRGTWEACTFASKIRKGYAIKKERYTLISLFKTTERTFKSLERPFKSSECPFHCFERRF